VLFAEHYCGVRVAKLRDVVGPLKNFLIPARLPRDYHCRNEDEEEERAPKSIVARGLFGAPSIVSAYVDNHADYEVASSFAAPTMSPPKFNDDHVPPPYSSISDVRGAQHAQCSLGR